MRHHPAETHHSTHLRFYLDSAESSMYQYPISWTEKDHGNLKGEYVFTKYGCFTVVSMTWAILANYRVAVETYLKVLSTAAGKIDATMKAAWASEFSTLDEVLFNSTKKLKLVELYSEQLLQISPDVNLMDEECRAHSKHAAALLKLFRLSTTRLHYFVRFNLKFIQFPSH
uniref:AlNc14C740G12473 protein n=1 Tax=Albugo laibachii Nc14 TaxID=890382 RepID=F0X1Z4_9STRA|nr:AlNc14C740G12473 [Albugo laibachii Nc14]|eukprot:CCA27853.1 AlNc14C740G12473 [Albugo laibachii Nc14]